MAAVVMAAIVVVPLVGIGVGVVLTALGVWPVSPDDDRDWFA